MTEQTGNTGNAAAGAAQAHPQHNSLAHAGSAYLRSAGHQPVEWMEWGEAAFARAAREDKPILLDIGAVWCHWCHVMDRESYEDPATAEVINQHFVAVKVDRDERPDVDTRYQAAISAISGQGGWPLTAFLTPDGKPYFGGTYFPLEDRHGRPGFRRVLLTMAEAFLTRRTEVDESATSVMNAIEHNESFSGRGGAALEDSGPELAGKMVLAVLQAADLRHGGFGSQPKFPHSGAIDLLIDAASRPWNSPVSLNRQETLPMAEAARRVALVTLDHMARGGVYDQLAGGFHRYAVDEHWTVPHFEKMAYDNSELLRNYVHAYQSFPESEHAPGHARVARDILRWMDEWLSDRARGGFYASQDADFSLDDDGDYFTWTLDEAAEVLSGPELAVAGPYYDIGEIGDMHHNVAKNVLHVRHSLEAVARKAGIGLEEAERLLEAARRKLYSARLRRPTPYVDKTVYVAWNAMCISAYLEASRVLEVPEARAFALKSLDRVLGEAWSPALGLAHVVAYGEVDASATQAQNEGSRSHVAGVLEDYVFLATAALDAWESTGEMRYYRAAEELADAAVARFYDPMGGGFFDTERPAEGERRLGALAARRKPLQDSPTPAGNPVAAALLVRLASLNGSADLFAKAEDTLETFSGVVEHFGLYAATYALALERLIAAPVQVCIVGTRNAAADALEAAALSPYAVNKSVIRLTREQVAAADLPPLLAETLPHLPQIASGQEGAFAIVCSGNSCQPPVETAEQLRALLDR